MNKAPETTDIHEIKKEAEEDDEKESFADMGIVDKILFIIDYPFMIIRNITMPPS